MIKGRKCRENTKVSTTTNEVNSPKRKDMKLSTNINTKIEMASTKKAKHVCKRSNRNKRDMKTIETSPTIKDFLYPKTSDFSLDKSKTNILLENKNSVELETGEIKLQKHDDASEYLDNTKQQHSPSKPVTPHRIVCLSPEKKKMEFLETTIFNDNKRSIRNKKRLDITFCENSSDEITIEQGSHIESKKQVLNSSANPTARQNTRNNKNSLKEEHTNKKLTDFFPIRRSVRKTNKEMQQELLQSYETAILQQSEDGLEVKNFENKGRGVVALRPFHKNEFVLEYIGELISMAEANKREIKYAKDENTGCYMYYFKYSEQQFCIDATEETGKLGRLVNHSRNGNLVTKTVAVKGQPHLILIAKNDIKPGVELTYDYGDRSKESLTHHPWLAY